MPVPILYKAASMTIDIENVNIHVRMLVETRNYEEKKKKIAKSDDDTHDSPR